MSYLSCKHISVIPHYYTAFKFWFRRRKVKTVPLYFALLVTTKASLFKKRMSFCEACLIELCEARRPQISPVLNKLDVKYIKCLSYWSFSLDASHKAWSWLYLSCLAICQHFSSVIEINSTNKKDKPQSNISLSTVLSSVLLYIGVTEWREWQTIIFLRFLESPILKYLLIKLFFVFYSYFPTQYGKRVTF